VTKCVSDHFLTDPTIARDLIAKRYPITLIQIGMGLFKSGFRALLSPFLLPSQIRLMDTVAFLVTLKCVFRGANAALLIFDVNQPVMLHALTRWWSDVSAFALPTYDGRILQSET
jgi:hypothetical protein